MTQENRITIQVMEPVDDFLGTDGRNYDLRPDDVVALPEVNAENLIENGVAERLYDEPELSGPAEPVVRDDGTPEFVHATNAGDVENIELGRWVCQRCGSTTVTGLENGELVEPHECSGCERSGPFEHDGGISSDDVQAAIRADSMWHPPSGVTDDGYTDLWDDVRAYLYDHWDAGSGDDADAVYAGLTAYALSTWVRENLAFVPHLMLMGKTTGGKTRLLNTLSRVSYRAIVSASATPASMFRLIDGYNVSYYISEYHGLHPDTRREVDAVVRAGQKENEVVTRAEPTSDGHEPMTFDPFTHVAIATQYEPDDDIVNRCIQVQSSTAGRDMPALLDDERAREIRNRLLYARFRLLDNDEWDTAERKAYRYLADRGIDGRTREKLVGLLTIGYLWGRVDALEGFVDMVVEQDQEAAADSEDALVVEAIRDLAFEQVGDTAVLGDSDPFAAVEIPYSDVAEHYERRTGTEKTSSWVGHVRKRLDFEKKRTRDGTVISDPDLGPKLRELCEDLNLDWERLESQDPVEELPKQDKGQLPCEQCGESRATYRVIESSELVCSDCATELREVST